MEGARWWASVTWVCYPYSVGGSLAVAQSFAKASVKGMPSLKVEATASDVK